MARKKIKDYPLLDVAKCTGDFGSGFFRVGPSQAQEALNNQVKQRRVRKHHLAGLRWQMAGGFWIPVPNSLGFTNEGQLFDGQHRCTAILTTGREELFLVSWGFLPETYDVVDTGAKRSTADILTVAGFPYASDVSAIVKNVQAFKDGLYVEPSRSGGNFGKYANHQILELAENEKDKFIHLATVNRDRSYRSQRLATPSQLGTLDYFFTAHSQAKAEEFLDGLATGVNLDKDSPILTLRKTLLDYKMSGLRYRARDVFAVAVKAWNGFLMGEKLTQIRWNPTMEKFPEIHKMKTILAKLNHEQQKAA